MRYKTILTPQVVVSYFKNEDRTPKADYTLTTTLVLDDMYAEVHIRAIRFCIVFAAPTEPAGVSSDILPYQVHVNFLEDGTLYQPGKVVANTVYDPVTGVLTPTQPSTVQPTYSTFCQMESTLFEVGPENLVWNSYNLKRSGIIKKGRFTALTFEVYFTTLNGERMHQNIPNVEIEFDVF